MNSLYALPREQMIKATFDWEAMSLWLQAWRGPYGFDETDAVSGDILAGGAELVQTSQIATNVLARPGGYARTDPIVFPNMPASEEPVTFLTLSETSTDPGTHRLILFINDAEGLPFTPNGQDQPVQPDWLNARGWFRP